MIKHQHTSEITVYLNRLDDNVKSVRNQVGEQTKLMGVIKDNAYGHGLIEVGKHLAQSMDWFCVSQIEEAVELRQAGINLPILVFEVPRIPTLPLYHEYCITATVSDLDTLPHLPEGCDYQIMIDTGMRRLGLRKDQISDIKKQISKRSDLHCSGIFTHFANAEVLEHERMKEALKLFKSIRSEFPSEWMTHTANSGTIFNYGEEYVFDAVRPGICLFGFSPSDFRFEGINPIMEWKTYVAQTRPVKKGDHVGYSSGWIAYKDGTVATLPVGYADGIPRLVKNCISFESSEKSYAQVGNVTMDYIMLFAPDNDLKVDDEITLIGLDHINAYYWAEVCGTIPYEITTQLNPGIKRTYIGD